jgi:hypothetical protein
MINHGRLIALFAVFYYFFLPEMQGRSLEELDELFQNRVSVKDFPKYHCVSSERAREIALKVTDDGQNEKEAVVVKEGIDRASSRV